MGLGLKYTQKQEMMIHNLGSGRRIKEWHESLAEYVKREGKTDFKKEKDITVKQR
jgi:hypothetical protein